MRHHLLPFLALTLIAAPLQSQQTADSIIARYMQRVGGRERIMAVQTLVRVGKLSSGGGFEARLVYASKRPNLIREEVSFGGMTGFTAYNGTSGWKTEPWGGKKDAAPLGEDETVSIAEDALFDDPLFSYRQKGNTVTLLGTDQVEGASVYKLRVTVAANGDVRTYFLDADSYVPIKYEVKRTIRGVESEFEVELGDYKPVRGWYLPFALAIGAKGSTSEGKSQTVWERIEANVPLDDALFGAPKVGSAPTPLVTSAGTPGTRPSAPAKRTSPAPVAAAAGTARVDSSTTSGLGARNIGSATMSGRIAALAAVHEGDRLTVYVGAASGGVWKSRDGGTTYKPVFDKQPVQSIGAITIDPTDPKVVWVGTGESWMRNSVSIGDGVYKSTDGGASWNNMGLKESEHVVKILVDSTVPNTVYVCVPGRLWSDSDDRGVYKTLDGGATWSKVLAGGNASTGCSMLAMDPRNPQVLYAGMWDFRRKGWTFRSGGDGPNAPSGSGLFKSLDGGATWTPLDAASARGLPPKPWGRVAVSVAPSNPDIVYAFIEAVLPYNAIYRSNDGGQTWEMKDRSQYVVWRPFYFANLIVDPNNPERIYKPDGPLLMSTDGGASFNYIGGGTHGDHHDLWVDPRNSDRVITGDDGGIWYSYDGGARWWKGENLPISQFYHVSVDMDRPYNVYGGLQDNSSWVGNSEYPGGITNSRWENMYGGDGFWMFADPTDSVYIYAESQGGYIGRINRETHEARDIQPLPGYREGKLRYNWNTPIHLSPTNKGTIYLGSQFLFRSTDAGQTWGRISPDLTTNNPERQKQEESGGVTVDNSSAEMYTTIFAIAESPLDPRVIWAGTDDGNLQLTRDGGATWTNVVGNIHGLPPSAWVTSVEAGHFAAGTVYATFDLHTFGDMRPYAYRSADFGATWTALVAPPSTGPVRGYAHAIKEDLVNPRLLFLGTEFGLWVSVDGGTTWSRYTGGGLPSVAVRDLAIHPRDNDLVIATHGRGIWIIDDIAPLRALTRETLGQGAAFLGSQQAVQAISAYGGWVNGDAAFVGPNPPSDALITYYLQKRHIFGDMKLEVRDSTGALVATLPTSKRSGLTRVGWPMTMPPPQVPPAATGGFWTGPRLLPGRYTVTLIDGDNQYATMFTVVRDPRVTHTMADRRAQYDLALTLYGMLGDMTSLVDRMNGLLAQLAAREAELPAGDTLASRLRADTAAVNGLRMKVVATREGGMITGEERLREYLLGLYGSVNGYEGRPSETQVARTAALGRELGDVATEFNAWVAGEVPPLNAMLKARKLAPLVVPAR